MTADSTFSLFDLLKSGGFVMIPLLLCSFAVWGVIFERLWSFRRLKSALQAFHTEAIHLLLRGDRAALESLCRKSPELPTSLLVSVALERLASRDDRIRANWQGAVERRRLILNQELRQNLWILGTIGSAAPFIGLFGTVVGILRAFQEMAKTGAGGFTVVAAGISESLVATAAGIVVAVIAVMAYNAFQTRLGGLVLAVRLQTEELVEMLAAGAESGPGLGRG
jgi:biopolymer transport protein ExbB